MGKWPENLETGSKVEKGEMYRKGQKTERRVGDATTLLTKGRRRHKHTKIAPGPRKGSRDLNGKKNHIRKKE